MTVAVGLREDALTVTSSGFELRVGLPWIRSMPLSCVSGLQVSIDAQPVDPDDLGVLLGRGPVSPSDLVTAPGWWYLQDRLVLTGPQRLQPGPHRVVVDFQLLVPYLSAGPDAPLVLPHHLEAELEPDVQVSPSVARDVA